MHAALEADQLFLDEFIREVYREHPEIAFEYRNRISYSDIPTVDPEETEEDEETSHLRNLFGESDDDSDEPLEYVLERRMIEDMDEDDRF